MNTTTAPPGLGRRVVASLWAAVAMPYVVLAIVYFLALTPIGLTMRLFRHDPLSRRLDPQAKSYWKPRSAAKSAEDYFNQS